jgi:dihydrofolate reductase
MTMLRVASFSLSLDGYGAGLGQSLEHPLGVRGLELHEWAFATRTFRRMFGKAGGTTGVDDGFAARGFEQVGAWIIGRNMFGPVRGAWPDGSWRGWWGESPPYHVPVFVLTHHARPSLPMAGGTTFHFITGGIHEALARARTAAGVQQVRLGGGVATIREYLEAGLIDELHLAIAPVLLGRGEALYHGLDLPRLGYVCREQVPGEKALHVLLTKQGTVAAPS